MNNVLLINELKKTAKCIYLTTEQSVASDISSTLLIAAERIKQLTDALPDPDKLELLANWIDMKTPDNPNHEVQETLREWARLSRLEKGRI